MLEVQQAGTEINNLHGFARRDAQWGGLTEKRNERAHAMLVDPTDQCHPYSRTPAASAEVEHEAMMRIVGDELAKMADDPQVLTPPQRNAFYGLLESGGTLADAVHHIADSTGQHEGTIRTHLNRAVKKLRPAIKALVEDDK